MSLSQNLRNVSGARKAPTTRFYVWVVVLLMVAGLHPAAVQGQFLNFALNAQEGIVVNTVTGRDKLDFNDVQRFIVPGTAQLTISPGLESRTALVPIEIQARADLDIMVVVIAPEFLELIGFTGGGDAPRIDFQLGWAYWNLAPSQGMVPSFSDPAVIAGAREVRPAVGIPTTFSSAIFPMRRRMSTQSPPPPPPTPLHGGGPVYPTTIAYVLIYGSVGPISPSTPSGSYSGDITIEVSYASYTP
jgi:hypothetical protein